MHDRTLVSRSAAIGGVSALLCASGSVLGAASMSPNFLTITATSGANTGTWIVPLVDDPFDDAPPVDEFLNFEFEPGMFFTGWDWVNGAPIELRDPNSNVLLLTLFSAGVTARCVEFGDGTPLIHGFGFDFEIQAGIGDVNIQIESGVLSFDQVVLPNARADVGLVMTDSAGSPAGAEFSGGFANGTAFQAMYNGGPLFREYLDFDAGSNPLVAGVTDTVEASGNMDPFGSFQPVGANVSSLQFLYNFNLTAQDQVGLSGAWEILPTPSSAVLLVLAGSTLGARRRRA